MRNNKAFESLTFNTRKDKLYAAVEEALAHDGSVAAFRNGTPVRIIEYSVRKERPLREFIYNVGPIAGKDPGGNVDADNGLVEMLAVSNTKFIMVERSFVAGRGMNIRLYLADISRATDVSRFFSMKGNRLRPTSRKLLLDLNKEGIEPDNIEGITSGLRLRDGRKTLVLVSDNNFNKEQSTQFLAFKARRF